MSNPFEQEISRSLAELKGWYRKLATPAAAGEDTEQRFNLKPPFDHLYNSYGLNLALECKKIEQERFPFAMVKDHQEAALLHYVKTAGPAYLLVNFRLTKRKHIKKLNKAFALPILQYLYTKERAQERAYGRCTASLRIEWFLDHAIELPRVSGVKGKNMYYYYWDLKILLDKGLRYDRKTG